jgi:uncharacterized protein (DUF488 family)
MTSGRALDADLTIWTIGHSTRGVGELIALLREAAVAQLVDIRSMPRSRTNPQFNAEALPGSLAVSGIRYRHMPALGGRRGRRRDAAPSANRLWQSDGFRNFADYAIGSPAFRTGLAELIALAGERRTAVMCAEAVWWRCHRRIVADYLLVAGVEVLHLLGPGHVEPARLTAGAAPQPNGWILYPAPASAQLSLL